MQYRTRLKLPAVLPFSCHVAVRVTDLNYGNHVGNEKMLEYLQEARVQFFASLGYTELNFGDNGIIMADVSVQYRHELTYPALLQIQIGILEMSAGAFVIGYRVVREAQDKKDHFTVAEATTTMVSFDYQAGRPVALQHEAAGRLTQYHV